MATRMTYETRKIRCVTDSQQVVLRGDDPPGTLSVVHQCTTASPEVSFPNRVISHEK